MKPCCLGDLVVLRLKWSYASNVLGVVVSDVVNDPDHVSVMWTQRDGSIKLSSHLADALEPVNWEGSWHGP